MADIAPDTFFSTLPVFAQFEGVVDGANYHPLPDGWAVATADIVDSTGAIASGRYKAVNMAGASVISAILNTVGQHDLPFVFGGDGALVAIPPSMIDKAREALSAVQRWATEEQQLTMRAAIVPIADIRAQSLDVRVARYQASSEVSYAMFAGGGAYWAEVQMKAGRYAVQPAPPGTLPDLTGLSCRWKPIRARHGQIVSVIAIPSSLAVGNAFQRLVSDIVAIASAEDRDGHPVAPEGPELGLTMAGLDMEARATAPPQRRLLQKLIIIGQYLLVAGLRRFNIRLGRFDAHVYTRDVGMNADFRKFDDGLKMTIDIDAERLGLIEARLEAAAAEGICRYGLHLQDSALMTCLVPTPLHRDHMHFIDGASGGYAVAATRLKEKQVAAPLADAITP
jgi:hypothetical protein